MAAAKESPDAPEIVAAVPTVDAKVEAEQARLSLIDEMKKYFRAERAKGNVRKVKIHNDSDVPVQINGYTFLVQKGVSVEVPNDVADLLEEAGYI